MPTIRPFHSQNNQTSINNYVFDYIMPNLSPNEWKVLCFIIRKTEGWNKPEDDLSISQIMDGTGIGNRTTASKAIKALEDASYVKVRRPGDGISSNTYSLNLEFELAIPDKQGSTEIVPASTVSVLPRETTQPDEANQGSTETVLVQKLYPQKENPTTTIPTPTHVHEEPITQESIGALLKQFLISSGLRMPRNQEKLDQWKADLGDIFKMTGGNLESAKKLIEDTIKALGNKYTIVGPKSIYDSCGAEWAKLQRQEPVRTVANGYHQDNGPPRASPKLSAPIDQEKLKKLQEGLL